MTRQRKGKLKIVVTHWDAWLGGGVVARITIQGWRPDKFHVRSYVYSDHGPETVVDENFLTLAEAKDAIRKRFAV